MLDHAHLPIASWLRNGPLIPPFPCSRWQPRCKARRPSPLPQSTGRAVVFSALSTIVGFGSLMISRHWGIFSVGLLLTVGVASVLLASVTVLPSLLAILSARGSARIHETDTDGEPSATAKPGTHARQGAVDAHRWTCPNQKS